MAIVEVLDMKPTKLRQILDEILCVTDRQPKKKGIVGKTIADMTDEGRYFYDEIWKTINETLEVIDTDGPNPYIESETDFQPLQKSMMDDLGADSLDLVTIIIELEKVASEKLGHSVSITDDQVEKLENLGGVYTFMCLVCSITPFK